MTNQISEKQNNYILVLRDSSEECRIFCDEYMEKTKGEPEKRDFQELLNNLVNIKSLEKMYGGSISKINIDKMEELRNTTQGFHEDIREFLEKRNKKSIEELTQYNAIQLKLLYIEKYLKER